MSTNGVAELETAVETNVETHALERAAIEAILFTAIEPTPIEQLAQAVGIDPSQVRSILDGITAQTEAPDRGIQLVTVAGGYRLVTKPEVADLLRRYRQVAASVRLSKPALETLAIVAYKQPVLRTEVEIIRGVDCAGVLKTLLDYRLIKIVGRRDVVGRPIVYGTTREFLEYLGLNDLTELPTLKEFEELAAQAPLAAPIVAESSAELPHESMVEPLPDEPPVG